MALLFHCFSGIAWGSEILYFNRPSKKLNDIQAMHKDYIKRKMDCKGSKLSLIHWRWISLSPNVSCLEKHVHFGKQPYLLVQLVGRKRPWKCTVSHACFIYSHQEIMNGTKKYLFLFTAGGVQGTSSDVNSYSVNVCSNSHVFSLDSLLSGIFTFLDSFLQLS